MTDYYTTQLEDGFVYQDFISEQLGINCFRSRWYQDKRGENALGIEIKLDKKFRQTGNLYIETEEKTNANNQNWVVSGIMRNDGSVLFLIGDYECAYLIPKRTLLTLRKQCREVETETSKGFLLPVSECEKWCLKQFKFDNWRRPSIGNTP